MLIIERSAGPIIPPRKSNPRLDIGRLHHWHMQAGLWIALAVILWALSGLGHPLISRLNPKPAAMVFPFESLDGAGLITPGDALAAAGIERFDALRLWQPAGEGPSYRAEAQGQAYWIDARTGAVRADGDRQWAERLARFYAGDAKSPIRDARLLLSFNNDYHYIDRLLPVWEIAFDRPDGLRAYVDPASGRLATLTDRHKDWTGKLFRWMHSWSPIQSSRWVQGLMLTLLLATASVAAAGLAVYVRLWRRGALSAARPGAVRWHRRLAVPAAVVALALPLSGALHLAVKAWQGDPTAPAPAQSFAITELSAPVPPLLRALGTDGPVATLALTRLDGAAAWIALPPPAAPASTVHHGGHESPPPPADRYVDARTGEPIPDGFKRHAVALARIHAGLPPGNGEAKPVHQFGGDYGFAFKRLPVMAVELPERPRETWYVETRTGALAAHLTPLNRFEGWVFGMIHKWAFLDDLTGKAGRELLQSTAALILVLTVGLGLTRHLAQRRQAA
ncbi:MAG TPA: hypothetical protein VNK45_10450 [Candidatus Acidoferrales bacterium]|nr:hypothetical protein [Candidatus Acidoferrales bacterium]